MLLSIRAIEHRCSINRSVTFTQVLASVTILKNISNMQGVKILTSENTSEVSQKFSKLINPRSGIDRDQTFSTNQVLTLSCRP